MTDAHSTVDLDPGKVQSHTLEILGWKHFDVDVLYVQIELHNLMWGDRSSRSGWLLCGIVDLH